MGQETLENPEAQSGPNAIAAGVQYLFAAALGSYLCGIITEADFYFHLLAGRWVNAHRTLPRVDPWTSALAGKSWYSESWLFDYALSVTEDRFGWTGLAVFKLSLCMLFAVAVSALFYRVSHSRFFGSLLAAIVACGALEQAPFGPQLVGFVLFTILIGANFSVRDGARLQGAWLSVFVCAAFFAGSDPAYFLLLVCSAAIYYRHRGRETLIFLAVLAAGLFCSPYLGAQLPYELSLFAARARFYIQSQSAASTVFDYSLSFLLLLWFLAAFIGFEEKKTERLSTELLLAGVVSMLALAIKFIVPYALILTGLVCAIGWARARVERKPIQLVVSFLQLEKGLARLPAVGVVWLLFCVFVVNSVNFVRHPAIDWLLPKNALDFALERKLPFPLWHESGIAPYVMYRLADERGDSRQLAALDSRAVVDHPEYLFEESKGLWKASFQRLKPHTILVRANTALYETLAGDRNYRLAFLGGEEVRPEDLQNKVEKPPFYAWALFTDAPADAATGVRNDTNLEPESGL